MARLENTLEFKNKLNKEGSRVLNAKLESVVKESYRRQLNLQVDANNNRLPIKAESTKKQYAKKGWNISKWFVRTGESVKIRNKGKGVFAPEKPENLKYVNKAEEFFSISKYLKTQIEKLLIKGLR